MVSVKRLVCFLLALLMMSGVLLMTASAEEEERGEAVNISGTGRIVRYTFISETPQLFDGNGVAPVGLGENASITLNYGGGIGSMYFVFNEPYGVYSVTDLDTGKTAQFGQNAFLHEFADLEEAFGKAPINILVSFDSGVGQLNELFLFSPGTPPDWVQRWEQPKEGETDLVLFSTHGDDEQLFFAGMLPYYGKELGYEVQVVYLTDHTNVTLRRRHEMLNGLWAVGVDNYPVFGTYSDRYSEDRETASLFFSYEGVTEEEILGFIVENIRRFRPMVAVGHDLEGEYGHGQHMVYADLLTKAIEITADPDQYPESAEQYGTWDVPKTYLHLYPENPIVMDWDQPLESFGGMTAFRVTKELGFACHVSQYYDFAWYISGAYKATDISQFSPCEYGLYRSTVGPDVAKNDLFENVKSHVQTQADAEAARLAAEEEAKRLEEERLAAEEAARQEAQRLEEERLAREAKELAEEEARLQLQQEAARQEELRHQKLTRLALAGAVALLLLLGVVWAIVGRKNNFEKFEKKT